MAWIRLRRRGKSRRLRRVTRCLALLRSAWVPVGLTLVGTAAITYKTTTWRIRRSLASLSATLSHVSAEGAPVSLGEVPAGDDVSELLAAAEATIGACQRTRWHSADLSHELRTPLTALRTGLEEARLYPDDLDVPRLINDSLASVRRAEAVLTNLLTLARLEVAGQLGREVFDLTALVHEEISATVGPHPVHMRPSDPVMVTGVREQIRQALTNLLDNAQRHARSRVEVEVGSTPGVARLIVDDDGDGIAEADRERIFLHRTRLEDNRRGDEGGVGLGLNITRMIAEAHGGSVQVEDPPPPCGARFVLRLPVSAMP